jgi:hypothetical protein
MSLLAKMYEIVSINEFNVGNKVRTRVKKNTSTGIIGSGIDGHILRIKQGGSNPLYVVKLDLYGRPVYVDYYEKELDLVY